MVPAPSNCPASGEADSPEPEHPIAAEAAAATEQQYELGRELGKGAYGVAILARRRCDGKQCVVKRLSMHARSSKEQRFARREVEVMRSIKHRYIISYIDSFVTADEHMHIVMEYAEGGTLRDVARAAATACRPLGETCVLRYMGQLATALRYLHSQGCLHRDVKAENVFLTFEGTVKLGDFGLSRMFSASTMVAQSLLGTPSHMSPEICNNQPYGTESDVWALGCVLYECCVGRRAFTGQSTLQVICKICKGVDVEGRPAALDLTAVQTAGYSDTVIQLISGCLTVDVALRIKLLRFLQSCPVPDPGDQEDGSAHKRQLPQQAQTAQHGGSLTSPNHAQISADILHLNVKESVEGQQEWEQPCAPPQPQSQPHQETTKTQSHEQHRQRQQQMPLGEHEQPLDDPPTSVTSGTQRRAKRRERLRRRAHVPRPRSMPPPVAVGLAIDCQTMTAQRPASWPRAQGTQHVGMIMPSLMYQNSPQLRPHRPRVLEPLQKPATEWQWDGSVEPSTSDGDYDTGFGPQVSREEAPTTRDKAWDEHRHLWEIRRLKELKALRDADLVPEIEYRDAVRLALGLAPIGTN